MESFADAKAPNRHNQPEYRPPSPISSQFKSQMYLRSSTSAWIIPVRKLSTTTLAVTDSERLIVRYEIVVEFLKEKSHPHRKINHIPCISWIIYILRFQVVISSAGPDSGVEAEHLWWVAKAERAEAERMKAANSLSILYLYVNPSSNGDY